MADFIDSEAEESEGEEVQEAPTHARKPKRSKAIQSDDEEDDDDGEEVKDLIDDNPIEEDESDAESDGSRKRKNSDDDFDDRLEDEDYDLLEENLGVKVQRKKFKRLKRIADEDSDEEGEATDKGEDKEAIANQLFEGSDTEEPDRPPQPSEAGEPYASDESEGEYSETDDFIVDDDGRPLKEKRKKRKPIFNDATLQEAQDIFGVDFDYDEFDKYEDEEYYEGEEGEEEDAYEDEEEGTGTRRAKKQPRKKRKPKSIYELYEPSELERAGLTEEDNRIRNQDLPERMQMRNVPITPAKPEELEEEAEWIYNVVFSKKKGLLLEQPTVISRNPTNDPSKSSAPPEDDWDEEFGDNTASKSKTEAKPTPSSAAAADDEEDWDAPADTGTTPMETDTPVETLPATVKQESAMPPPAIPPNDEDDWEAPSTIISSSVPPINPRLIPETETSKAAEEVKDRYCKKIKNALDFMRNSNFEVPFIFFYRKEYVRPELENISDLWEIYRADAKFCQLRTRKFRLLELFKNMKDYQTEKICENPDQELSPTLRLISDDDFERVRSIKTSEELKDMYSQFTLYYSEDIIPMKTLLARKKKEREQREKERAKLAARVNNEDNDENDEATKEPEEIQEDKEDDVEEQSQLKRKMGGGPYALCKKMGLDSFTKLFGLQPKDFAENVRDTYQANDVDQHHIEPLEAAKEYIIEHKLPTAEDVLKAAKYMHATQLSREPILRQSVRQVFFDSATITVRPTKKGLKEIDENHPCYGMKYLKDKSVKSIQEDEFLKLTAAEADKLITLEIGENIKALNGYGSYVEECKKLYHLEEFSSHVQAWNAIRGECVEMALNKFLFPVLRKELRAKLLDEAKEFILKECADELKGWITPAPYKTSFSEEDAEEYDVSKGLKVLALSYVPDLTQASFACFITPDGEPSDYLRLQNITKKKKSFLESDRLEKEADLLAVKNFMRQKRPHVVVIGGESRDALMIQEDLRMVVQELSHEDNLPLINVEIVDNQLSKVYANSVKASVEFREYPMVLRQAISLGRLIQEPLVEFSQLCTPDEELLCLHFHKFQDQVPKEELLERLYLEFVNVVNQVGVDVNRAISIPYTSNLVQFVCGLGSRKATALLKTLKHSNQRLENRTQLITVCHMGPKIFINCSGFIKIDTNSLGDSTESYVEVLDGSRVHPETYEWARKMAVDALEYDDEDTNPAGALEEILESPERLKELDLDAFAEELGRQGFGDKRITLYDIRNELNNRYKDFREPWTSPGPDALFRMLTKETPQTMFLGKLITCQVVGISFKKPQGEQLDNAVPVRKEDSNTWQCPFCMKNFMSDLSEMWNHFDTGGCPGQAVGVRVRLDNGISGFIPISKLSDKQVTNPEDRVKRGQTIHCRVVKIDVERFQVECTSRTSDLVDANHDLGPRRDEDYDIDAELLDRKKEEDARKSKMKQTYIKRVIVHPSFKNISFKESEKLMEHMDQGEAIVRPSSKGADHLTVTWKVYDGVYQHIDVREEGKENAFSLGQKMWIGKEEFEDLDEIIARHVHPMAAYCRDIINFKYHSDKFDGNRHKAEEFLLEEKKKNVNKIHYIMYASKEYPGKFYLSYLPRTKVVHEFITITPEGYRFRQQNFDGLNQLFKWFKEHYRDPPPTITPATPRTVAPARTPYGATPGHMDAMSRVGGAPSIINHNTPHFATPGNQAYTPFSAMTPHTQQPYTPTAQTPYMTPYTTPHQSTASPRVGQSQPSTSYIGGMTPGMDTQRRSSSSIRPAPRSVHGGRSNENEEWKRAASNWAANITAKPTIIPPAPASSRFGGGDGGQWDSGSTFGRPPPKSPAARNAAEVIHDGINKTKQMSSSALNYLPTKSPRSGRESLRSTPRTNFSPRSMVESSLGDETPLYDEN